MIGMTLAELAESVGDDPVNAPTHYTSGGIDTLDFIRCKKLDYLAGNVVKYIVRHRIKGDPLQDLQKARVYLNRMIQEEEDALLRK